MKRFIIRDRVANRYVYLTAHEWQTYQPWSEDITKAAFFVRQDEADTALSLSVYANKAEIQELKIP